MYFVHKRRCACVDGWVPQSTDGGQRTTYEIDSLPPSCGAIGKGRYVVSLAVFSVLISHQKTVWLMDWHLEKADA